MADKDSASTVHDYGFASHGMMEVENTLTGKQTTDPLRVEPSPTTSVASDAPRLAYKCSWCRAWIPRENHAPTCPRSTPPKETAR